ncbi:MAG: hypothetical protein LLG37_06465 [Spirochaetia bacterium]|nr:hypothetical protein [Spirochaetia bacterium]
MGKYVKKAFRAVFVFVVLFLSAYSAMAAVCTPVSGKICVAIDDYADVWVNSHWMGQFSYVNWDQTGVYPTCLTFSVGSSNTWEVPFYATEQNIVAIEVSNLRCCEIWGSWSIDITCSSGDHSYMSSDDGSNRIYNNYAPLCSDCPYPARTPPANDGGGLTWWSREYQNATPWPTPIKDQGTIWGKQIYHPLTGALMQPLSYDTGGNADTGDGGKMYMRQQFFLTPTAVPPPPQFSITKTVLPPTSGIQTGQRVTYILHVCNEGSAEPGVVRVDDLFTPSGGMSYGGPNDACGCDYCFGPNYCGTGNGFNVTWPRGFAGFTCVNLTVTALDYWLDTSEYCQNRSNVAGVHWSSIGVGTPDASSNTVVVQMYCPSSTFTRTPTPTVSETLTLAGTRTFTPTWSLTYTLTPTSTRTRIPTLTQTMSFTFSPSVTLSRTITMTWTPGPPVTYTFTPTITRSFTRTITPTRTVTVTFTGTFTPTFSATPTVTNTWANAIQLAKSEDKQQVPFGDTVQYCLTFKNVGENPAAFTIWDTLPYEVDFLWCSESCNYFTWGDGKRGVSWSFTNVPPGMSGSVCFWVQVARWPLPYFKPKMYREYFAYLKDFMFAQKSVEIKPAMDNNAYVETGQMVRCQ